MAAGALAGPSLRAQAAGARVPPRTDSTARADTTQRPLLPVRGGWDMSWTDRLTAPRRQVFDSPEIADGAALHQARMFLQGYKDVYGLADADLNAVLVFRHKGIPMVLRDEIWARYDFIGKKITRLKDPTTGKDAARNPFLRPDPADKHSLVWSDGGLDTLIARGVIVLACNMALMGFAGIIAQRAKRPVDDVRQELKESLVPGVTLMPSGIFAVCRAEEAGCHFLQAT